MAPDSDFGALARGLEKEGVKSELRNDSVPSIGPVLTFTDNKGTTIALFKEWSYWASTVTPRRRAAQARPYRLGGRQPGEDGRVLQQGDGLPGLRLDLRLLRVHALQLGSSHGQFHSRQDLKMHHMAFELKDSSICRIPATCSAKKIPIIWGPLRHGPGHNIATYHRNPDDQVIEFFCELDKMVDEELGYFEPRPWHQDTPQRRKTWQAGKTSDWGPPPIPEFHRGRDAVAAQPAQH